MTSYTRPLRAYDPDAIIGGDLGTQSGVFNTSPTFLRQKKIKILDPSVNGAKSYRKLGISRFLLCSLNK